MAALRAEIWEASRAARHFALRLAMAALRTTAELATIAIVVALPAALIIARAPL